MNKALQQSIGQVLELFEQTKFDEAEIKLRYILKIYPNNLPALNILSLVFAAQLKHTEAVETFKRALRQSPSDGSLHYNIAKALQELDKHRESLPHHVKAIQLLPNNIDARLNYGRTLAALRDYSGALTLYENLLKINPSCVEALSNAGSIFVDLKRYEEALASYDQAIRLNPEYFEAWSNKGICQGELRNYEGALASYEQAIRLKPDYHEAYSNKGNALLALMRYEEALASYDQAIRLNPEYFEAWSNKGACLTELKRYEEALASYDQAIRLNPEYFEAWSNKGICQGELRNYEGALASYEQAIRLKPDYHEAIFNQSALQLQLLNFLDGWHSYESRWRVKNFNSKPLVSSKPRWTGNKNNNRLLIWAEQGIGDQILFGSFLTELNEFPQKIIISLDCRLLNIFSRSFPNFVFIDKDQPFSEDLYDEQIPIGSIGQFFRKEIADFKFPSTPYLIPEQPNTNLIKLPKEYLTKKICGIAWRSINPRLGREKSIPLNNFLPILDNADLRFINLQYGETQSEINSLISPSKEFIYTVPQLDTFNDIDGLFSILNACDVVITTSNTTAHLAGACGKEVLLLLPYSVGKFWYWVDVQGKSLFYPSIKIFQQKTQGDWSSPLKEIQLYLESSN